MSKKNPTEFPWGFLLLYDDILFLVALSTVGGILHAESLGAVVASTAVLAFHHFLHGHHVGAFLHLEKARLMAISALEALVGVNLAVKNHLCRALGFELNGLAGGNCERRDGENECYNCYDRYDEKLFHYEFHLLSSLDIKTFAYKTPGTS